MESTTLSAGLLATTEVTRRNMSALISILPARREDSCEPSEAFSSGHTISRKRESRLEMAAIERSEQLNSGSFRVENMHQFQLQIHFHRKARAAGNKSCASPAIKSSAQSFCSPSSG